MPELLIEVGCEELPATFVRKAYDDLARKLVARLAELGVAGGEPVAMGTPRRLIVSIPDVPQRQEDAVKPTRGPALKAAFVGGEPTRALEGFLRGQGATLADVRDDGTYVWIDKAVPGRMTEELLREAIPAAIRSLSFEKSMRWGASRMRFARPLRWIVALYGGTVVPFEIEGVASADLSRGHRFYAPVAFGVSTLETLVEGLRERRVEPDPAVRRRMIEEGAQAVAAPGAPDLPEALVEENTFLTEWPTPVQGLFKREFEGLPEPVLVTAMAKHERMFPVREDGRLTNRFVFVRNSGEDDTVRAGAEWVLNARLQDAKFFAEGDAALPLEDLLARTEGILFAERLGTVRQRADRLQSLIPHVAAADDGAGDANDIHLAARYAKADLASGLVSELASLQGIIGGEYARREGLSESVAFAISRQYDPAAIGAPNGPEARTAWRLVIADALDKLAGYLGLGMAPTGSSDPYALRRAATQLIEAAWAWPNRLTYEGAFEIALGGYEDAGVDLDPRRALSLLVELFATRYPALLPDVRHDVLDAAMLRDTPGALLDPQGVRFRTEVLTRLIAENPTFVTTATRPLNLVAAAAKKGFEIGVDDPLHRVTHSALESAEGLDLLQALTETDDPLGKAVTHRDVDGTIRLLLGLEAPINRFLDGTMILVDDPEIRYARLTLLWGASRLLLRSGDFSKLEG